MYEYNFFDPYLPVPQKTNYVKILGIVLFVCFAAAMAFYHWTLMLNIKTLEPEINSLEMYINSPKTKQKLDELDIKQKRVEETNLFVQELSELQMQVSVEYSVNSNIFDVLNDQMTNDLFLTELSVSQGTLNLQGFASSRELVAQYTYNLRMTGAFLSLEIPYVISLPEGVNFTLVGQINKEAFYEGE